MTEEEILEPTEVIHEDVTEEEILESMEKHKEAFEGMYEAGD